MRAVQASSNSQLAVLPAGKRRDGLPQRVVRGKGEPGQWHFSSGFTADGLPLSSEIGRVGRPVSVRHNVAHRPAVVVFVRRRRPRPSLPFPGLRRLAAAPAQTLWRNRRPHARLQRPLAACRHCRSPAPTVRTLSVTPEWHENGLVSTDRHRRGPADRVAFAPGHADGHVDASPGPLATHRGDALGRRIGRMNADSTNLVIMQPCL